ncbi:MAG: hypothetical protein F6K36_15350 [Symploca sp. SIO3C6]|uniref:Uncharacterized protein n=1 Tax=Symploca sp. SIO1C4 TaxID=2607765 RepID=A0A6B3NMG0_9CYAN|nr:hypothetical protein [Symploca sp. SIO3C6]NER32095.1 hypothetical protein [Symploca sp. SIO1C4]
MGRWGDAEMGRRGERIGTPASVPIKAKFITYYLLLITYYLLLITYYLPSSNHKALAL